MRLNFGAKIRELRRRDGRTQEHLAEALGVTAQAVSRWENEISLPDITLVPRIAEVLEVSCDDLLGEKEPCITHHALAGGIMVDVAEIMIRDDIDVLF